MFSTLKTLDTVYNNDRIYLLMKFEHWKSIPCIDKHHEQNVMESYITDYNGQHFSLCKVQHMFEFNPTWRLYNPQGDLVSMNKSSRKPITTPPFKWADKEISDYIEDNSNKN